MHRCILNGIDSKNVKIYHCIEVITEAKNWKYLHLLSFSNIDKAHHTDEIPERDVTYHLTCLLIHHGTTTHL